MDEIDEAFTVHYTGTIEDYERFLFAGYDGSYEWYLSLCRVNGRV